MTVKGCQCRILVVLFVLLKMYKYDASWYKEADYLNKIAAAQVQRNFKTTKAAMHLLGHARQLLQVSKNQGLLDGGLEDTVVVLRNRHAGEEIRQDAAGGRPNEWIRHLFTFNLPPVKNKAPPPPPSQKGALFHTYPKRSASSTRNFGRFESLKALMRTTSSLR